MTSAKKSTVLKWALYNGQRVVFVISLAFLITGCGTLGNLKVDPRPAPYRELPPAPIAVIRVPVVLTIPVGRLTGQPSFSLNSKDVQKNISKWIDFTKGQAVKAWEDPLHLEASKNTLSALLKLHYRLGGDAFGIAVKGVGKFNDIVGTSSEKETLVKAQTALRWNPAWHMDSFYSIPMVGSLNRAVTSSAQKAGELVQKAGEEFLVKGMDQFDERLRVLTDIEPKAKEVWSQIQDPINLEKGIWFLLQPKSMSVGEVRIDPRHPETVRTIFQMKAQPEILFGPKPGALKSQLPPLSKFERGPVGFHAVSNLLITYPEAIQLIQDLHMGIMGHVFKETGDRKLRVKGMRFYGSGGKVVAEVKLEYDPILNLSDQPAKMTVYLVGSLKYYPKSRVFQLPDLDFDVKTGDFLVQVAEWIFKSDIRKLLRQKARIPIGPKLDDLKQKLTEALNRPLGERLNLTTQVRDFRVMEAFADNDGMKARVALDGDADLNVDWK